MFDWLFKLMGYVPIQRVKEMESFMQEVAEKATDSANSKIKSNQSKPLDVRTLVDLLMYEGAKHGNEIGCNNFLDGTGCSIDEKVEGKLFCTGERDSVFMNVDIPAYPGGPLTEVWVLAMSDHSLEDMEVETCCWHRTIY